VLLCPKCSLLFSELVISASTSEHLGPNWKGCLQNKGWVCFCCSVWFLTFTNCCYGLCSLCNIIPFIVIVKATNGPRYVVGCRRQLDKAKLKSGTRVALDMTTLTIMRYLPREVDPLVYNMSHEDPGDVSYAAIGGLSEQIRELREVTMCNLFFEIWVWYWWYTRISIDY